MKTAPTEAMMNFSEKIERMGKQADAMLRSVEQRVTTQEAESRRACLCLLAAQIYAAQFRYNGVANPHLVAEASYDLLLEIERLQSVKEGR